MPNLDWGVYATGETEGTEVSSTYEGRHVTCTAAELITDGGSGVAVKGHACVFGLLGLQAVGVCFNSGTLTDLIAIDTEGIWNLPVDGDDDSGNAILRPGSAVYINVSTCVISGITDEATQVPFGYLLTQVASAGNDVISAVKVHWDPPTPEVLELEQLTLSGQLIVDDTTLAPNGLTGSIQTDGGIGVMGQSAFESTCRFQGDVTFNARILAGGEINNNGPCILNGTLNVAGNVHFGGAGLFRVLGPANLDNADVRLNNLPGGAPVEVGRLWNNGGVVTIV